jgi:hypothetical protein
MKIRYMVLNPQGVIYKAKNTKKEAEDWAIDYLEKNKTNDHVSKYLEIREIIQNN